MYLIHKPSNRPLAAAISEVASKDHRAIKKNRDFSFDWETEAEYEVYKIYLLSDDKTILGPSSGKQISCR
jgi:hypothetical protein